MILGYSYFEYCIMQNSPKWKPRWLILFAKCVPVFIVMYPVFSWKFWTVFKFRIHLFLLFDTTSQDWILYLVEYVYFAVILLWIELSKGTLKMQPPLYNEFQTAPFHALHSLHFLSICSLLSFIIFHPRALHLCIHMECLHFLFPISSHQTHWDFSVRWKSACLSVPVQQCENRVSLILLTSMSTDKGRSLSVLTRPKAPDSQFLTLHAPLQNPAGVHAQAELLLQTLNVERLILAWCQPCERHGWSPTR